MLKSRVFIIAAFMLLIGGVLLVLAWRCVPYLQSAQHLEFPLAPDRTAPLRFFALGDTGSSDTNQTATAATMARFHRESPADFVLMLGDLVYPAGLADYDDSQLVEKFDHMYPRGSFDIPFFPVLGNHDYGGLIWATIDYSLRNPRWRFPSRYYSFAYDVNGQTVEFFAVDTHALTRWYRRLDGQFRWLERRLSESKAHWKIVYGHYPAFTFGKHHKSRHTLETRRQLLPLLAKYCVAAFFSGHDHNLQLIDSNEGVLQIISGGGGAPLYRVSNSENALFGAEAFGFTAVEVAHNSLSVNFISSEGDKLYSHSLSDDRMRSCEERRRLMNQRQ